MAGTTPREKETEWKGWVLANLVNHKDQLVGYRVWVQRYEHFTDDTNINAFAGGSLTAQQMIDIPLAELPARMATIQPSFFNAVYDDVNNAFNGRPRWGIMGTYPSIITDTERAGQSTKLQRCFLVTRLGKDKDTGKIIAFERVDEYGQTEWHKYDELEVWKKRVSFSNVKINNGILYDRANNILDESNFDVVEKKDAKHMKIYSRKMAERIIAEGGDTSNLIEADKIQTDLLNTDELSTIDFTYMTEVNKQENRELKISAITKFQQALRNLKKVSPYFYNLVSVLQQKGRVIPLKTPIALDYSGLTKEEYEKLDQATKDYVKLVAATGHKFDTLCVSEDTLYYNINFVDQLNVSQLTFILIHEMLHIVSQHGIRLGNRNPQLWNIACDLYINTYICASFGCIPNGDIVNVNGGTISAFREGIFLDNQQSVAFDFGATPPEIIYKQLLAENPDGFEIVMPDSLQLGGETPKIIINKDLPQQPKGQGGGSSSSLYTQELGKRLQEVIADLTEESVKIRDKGTAIGLEALKCKEDAKKWGATSSQYKTLQEKHNNLVEKANKIASICDSIEDDLGDIAEIAIKLSLGRIKKSTAEQMVDTLNDKSQKMTGYNDDCKTTLGGTNNKILINASNELSEVANALKEFADKVPRHAVAQPPEGGMGGFPAPESGIVPDELEMNPDEDNSDNNEGGQSGDADQDNPNDNTDQTDGGGQGGDEGTPTDGGGQVEDEGNPTDGKPSNGAGQGGNTSQRTGSMSDNGQSALGTGNGAQNQGGYKPSAGNDIGNSGSNTGSNNGANQTGSNNGVDPTGSTQGNNPLTDIDDDSIFSKDGKLKTDNIGSTPTIKVKFNGKEITGKVSMDIQSSEGGKNEEAQKKRISRSKDTLKRMKNKIEIEKAKGNLGDPSKKEKPCEGGAARELEIGISHLIDWKQIFADRYKPNSRITSMPTKTNYQRIARGDLRRGKRDIEFTKIIKNVIIGVDVSGSVGDEQLQSYLSEIWGMMEQFGAGKGNAKSQTQILNGELVYWSTNVGDSGEFKNAADLQKVSPKSTGGTDVEPFFRYVTGKLKTETGKVEKIRLRECPLILIITDGDFKNNYSNYKDILGDKVVWMIDGYARDFNPPFGKVAQLISYNTSNNRTSRPSGRRL